MINRNSLFPRLAWSADTAASESGVLTPSARFGTIMLPHLDAAFSYALYLSRDSTRAEDIVQEAFLRAFRSFDGWHGDAPRAWLFAIVRNVFVATATEPHWQSLDGVEATSEAAIDRRHPEAIVAQADEATMLRQMIADLPAPFRETLVLRELDELSYREIAGLTGVPIGTVMSRLARGRQMLAALLLPVPVGGGAPR